MMIIKIEVIQIIDDSDNIQDDSKQNKNMKKQIDGNVYNGPSAMDRFSLKIAYDYFHLHLMGQIYNMK